MDDKYLKRKLTNVGRRVFVEYFREFSDESLSNQEVADLLPYDYTLKSRLSRTSHARAIIRQGLAKDALALIAQSTRVDPAAAAAAAALSINI